jgi:hypothetical protein
VRQVHLFNLRLMPLAALAVLVLALPACNLLSPAAETPPVPTLDPFAQVTPFEAGEADTPAPPPTEAAPDTGGMSGVNYEGIAFTYPSSLATEVRAETVPREEVAGDAPFWASAPEHVTFTFEGYPADDPIHTPTIYVYPAAEFAQVNEFAGGVIGGLNDLLASRPETPPDPIPFFPIFNAAQVFHAHFTYLDFASGSGVRYLTHFSQAPIVVANDNVIYTYQGLSADGAWVVSAVLPVSSPILPATGNQPPGDDWDAFAANYPEYLFSLVAELEAQPSSSFTPSLDTLDAMIASITIQR